MSDWRDRSHRRYDALRGTYILVSPHRNERPWQGEVTPVTQTAVSPYDPSCALCPGNARAASARNPPYGGVYVFDNDFPALSSAPDGGAYERSPRIRAQAELGTCRVLCFSPRHDLTFGTLCVRAARDVVDAWAEQYRELGSRSDVRWVQIFENRGAMMGASSPHPHAQIWAQSSLPNEALAEDATQRAHLRAHRTCLLCAYLDDELRDETRILEADEAVVTLVPFWAVWPFEVLVLPRRHVGSLAALAPAERDALAAALARTTRRYDALFASPFPYSMGFHQTPANGAAHDAWHLHAHYYPPLLRSATIRKFMVGYEMLAEPQRDLTPESAAARLRAMDATQ